MVKKTIDDCEDFEILDFLGSGAYGAVFAGREKHGDKKIVAIKSCKEVLSSRTLAKRTLRELRILRQCEHPNIVDLLYILVPKDADNLSELNFAFELLDTDLAQVIRSPQVLLVDHVQYFVVQLVSALDYLHRSNIIHRDVKPRNILINADCTLKLADFGLAKVFRSGVNVSNTAITDYVTTRWYRAPEVLGGCSSYGAAIDMWAVGCIIVELFQRVPLFPGTDTNRQIELIVSSLGLPDAKFMAGCKRTIRRLMMRLADVAPNRPNLKINFGRIPKQAIDLITKLLTLDPSSRLSAADCLSHPFLACTNYASFLNEKLIQLDQLSFAHEEREITIDILRAELLREVKCYHSTWGDTEQAIASAEEQEESIEVLPCINVSSDAARELDLERDIPLLPVPQENLSFSEPIKTICSPDDILRSFSNDSIYSTKTEIKGWMDEDGRSSFDTRQDRVMSRETIVEEFVPPPDLERAPLKESTNLCDTNLYDNSNFGRNISGEPSNRYKASHENIIPVSSDNMDYELKSIRDVPDQESAVTWTRRPVSMIEQALDCKSLLSFGLCSSSYDALENQIINNPIDVNTFESKELIGKKRSLQQSSFSSSTDLGSSNSMNSMEIAQKVAISNSCIIC